MDEGVNFKALFMWFFVFVGGVVYVRSHYTLEDVLKYSRERPHPVLSPKVDYYVGWAYFHREDHPKAHKAFDQLLTSYPTCQYAPPALYRKGLMYTEDGRWAQAREVLERYLKEFPNAREKSRVERNYERIKFRK